MMENFPESLADAEVCDIDIDIDLGEEEFVFHGEWLTEARVEEIAEQVFRARSQSDSRRQVAVLRQERAPGVRFTRVGRRS
jgi:hypothetical protein